MSLCIAPSLSSPLVHTTGTICSMINNILGSNKVLITAKLRQWTSLLYVQYGRFMHYLGLPPNVLLCRFSSGNIWSFGWESLLRVVKQDPILHCFVSRKPWPHCRKLEAAKPKTRHPRPPRRRPKGRGDVRRPWQAAMLLFPETERLPSVPSNRGVKKTHRFFPTYVSGDRHRQRHRGKFVDPHFYMITSHI